MNKSAKIVIGLIVLVVLVGGGYAIFHKSKKPATTSSSSSSTNSSTQSSAVVVTKTSSTLGQYLAEPSGQPLYTYASDTNGVSNCTGSCITNWPAYQATGSTSSLPAGVSTIKRSDNGETQYTYNGLPLYTFVGDSAGHATGNGVDNFKLAKPTASSSAASSTSNTAPTVSTNTTPAVTPAASTSSPMYSTTNNKSSGSSAGAW